MSNSFTVKELNDDDNLFPVKKEEIPSADVYYLDRAPESDTHYNIRTMSYSSLLTLHGCPRKYELNRLLPYGVDVENDEDAAGHLDFGTVVGNGIQELLVTGSMDRAMFRAFLDWKDNLESERGERAKKTFWHALQAIQKFSEIMDNDLSQYEVATFQGRPAVELGFAIDCGKGFTYRGKLDALLIHKVRREFLPLECKTTGMSYVDEAMYANSSQGIGYGVVIDRVAAEMQVEYNSYDIFYPVYMTKKTDWMPYRFQKSNIARALWLQSLLLEVLHIEEYATIGYFPTRGESCFSFGRQCRHYGLCHISNDKVIGNTSLVPIKLDKKKDYPLFFNVDQLIEAQIEKEVE